MQEMQYHVPCILVYLDGLLLGLIEVSINKETKIQPRLQFLIFLVLRLVSKVFSVYYEKYSFCFLV